MQIGETLGIGPGKVKRSAFKSGGAESSVKAKCIQRLESALDAVGLRERSRRDYGNARARDNCRRPQ